MKPFAVIIFVCSAFLQTPRSAPHFSLKCAMTLMGKVPLAMGKRPEFEIVADHEFKANEKLLAIHPNGCDLWEGGQARPSLRRTAGR
jgi:hypothetical protein